MNFDEVPKTWKKRVANYRLSQEDFCKGAGIYLTTFTRIIAGSGAPTLITFQKVEDHLAFLGDKHKELEDWLEGIDRKNKAEPVRSWIKTID